MNCRCAVPYVESLVNISTNLLTQLSICTITAGAVLSRKNSLNIRRDVVVIFRSFETSLQSTCKVFDVKHVGHPVTKSIFTSHIHRGHVYAVDALP